MIKAIEGKVTKKEPTYIWLKTGGINCNSRSVLICDDEAKRDKIVALVKKEDKCA